MKLFYLFREIDDGGNSGTGICGEGVVFDNGKVALTWNSVCKSVTIYDNVEQVILLHGHGNHTRLIWAALSVLEATDV